MSKAVKQVASALAHPWDRERTVKAVRPRKRETVHIPVLGHRDPRGPDNNIRVWVDEKDRLHIRVLKADRCYKYARAISDHNHVEVIAE